uniref:Uncharacterized protein n=1 Tax=Gadus morhua TaxID=8049 RepID=A0A8C5B9N7_GADMO
FSILFLNQRRLCYVHHKLQRSVSVGEDLTLELITPQAQRVVFQERNGSSWGLLWQRGGAESPRLRRVPGREELVLTHPTPEDQGFYKVLDGHGLAVSTLLLSVRDTQLYEYNISGLNPLSLSLSLCLSLSLSLSQLSGLARPAVSLSLCSCGRVRWPAG